LTSLIVFPSDFLYTDVALWFLCTNVDEDDALISLYRITDVDIDVDGDDYYDYDAFTNEGMKLLLFLNFHFFSTACLVYI
jgi:hypothetical protein